MCCKRSKWTYLQRNVSSKMVLNGDTLKETCGSVQSGIFFI